MQTKFFKKTVAVVLLSLAITACNQDGTINRQSVGALTGAGAGAFLGSGIGKGTGNTAAIAIGTVAGALAGSHIVASMDQTDQRLYYQTQNRALEVNRTGQKATWYNPDTGVTGTIIPTATYQDTNGQYCREFKQTIIIGGRPQDAYGVACKQGRDWVIKN
jgi:surface antigen